MLTKEEYDKIPVGIVFREGISTNSPSGVYMVNNDPNRLLRWIAVKEITGWTIYIYWSLASSEYVKRHGDKITSKDIIKKLITCEEEVYNLYD